MEFLRVWWEFLMLHSHWREYVPTPLWDVLGPVIIWGQVLAFLILFLIATAGRRLKLRRRYVEFLDQLFTFASFALGDNQPQDEEDEEEVKVEQEEGVVICPESPRADLPSPKGTFQLIDAIPYLTAGMRAVVQDCVTTSFTSAELRTWNMLSRTRQKKIQRKSIFLTLFWFWGFWVRWVFFMPVRLMLLVTSLATLVVLCSLVGILPDGDFKRKVNKWVVCWCFDFVAGSLSVVARFHHKEHRPTHGIAVANHTSPIDSMVLATDQCYDMVGQRSRGILGMFMRALAKSSSHIWFERTEAKERAKVAAMLQNHAQDTLKPPILIFPEGICVNNTAVMQFKKGAFEIDCVIYPIAIRFDPRYGDAFWHQDTFFQYVFSMVTSWAIVVDVFYLPPMCKRPGESASAFANRVKALIAHRGGFVQLAWDGSVKLAQRGTAAWIRKEEQWRNKQQEVFARHFTSEEDSHDNVNEIKDQNLQTGEDNGNVQEGEMKMDKTLKLISDNINLNGTKTQQEDEGEQNNDGELMSEHKERREHVGGEGDPDKMAAAEDQPLESAHATRQIGMDVQRVGVDGASGNDQNDLKVKQEEKQYIENNMAIKKDKDELQDVSQEQKSSDNKKETNMNTGNEEKTLYLEETKNESNSSLGKEVMGQNEGDGKEQEVDWEMVTDSEC